MLVGARNPEHWLERARLLSQNIATQVAHDGAAAQCLASRVPFDLILIDVDTSVLDGLFLIARPRRAETERPEPSRVPVLVFTAMHTPPFEALLRYRGIDDVLHKDASAQVLADCLQRWCPQKCQLASA
jgi:DNA-binding response OmpR family regulator